MKYGFENLPQKCSECINYISYIQCGNCGAQYSCKKAHTMQFCEKTGCRHAEFVDGVCAHFVWDDIPEYSFAFEDESLFDDFFGDDL